MNLDIYFFFWETSGYNTAEGEPSTCIHGASRAARATCTSSVHCSLSGQSRGVDAVEDEDNDEVHGTEAVLVFL